MGREDDLVNTVNDADNFLKYVQGGMKGEYDKKKKSNRWYVLFYCI